MARRQGRTPKLEHRFPVVLYRNKPSLSWLWVGKLCTKNLDGHECGSCPIFSKAFFSRYSFENAHVDLFRRPAL